MCRSRSAPLSRVPLTGHSIFRSGSFAQQTPIVFARVVLELVDNCIGSKRAKGVRKADRNEDRVTRSRLDSSGGRRGGRRGRPSAKSTATSRMVRARPARDCRGRGASECRPRMGPARPTMNDFPDRKSRSMPEPQTESRRTFGKKPRHNSPQPRRDDQLTAGMAVGRIRSHRIKPFALGAPYALCEKTRRPTEARSRGLASARRRCAARRDLQAQRSVPD